jgi:hypothetical protein
MPRKHPEPVGKVTVPVYRDLDPAMTVGGFADYFGVKKQLVAKWARESPDWPSPFATPTSGAIYLTAEVIAWADRHERKRAEGPRPAGDARPPSVQKARKRRRVAA